MEANKLHETDTVVIKLYYTILQCSCWQQIKSLYIVLLWDLRHKSKLVTAAKSEVGL